MNEQKHKVMIVDDDSHVRIAVRTILGDAGFSVVTADSGNECINILQKGFSGVVLLDVMMPDMDGWDTIKAILDNSLTEGIIIVMLTAKSVPDTKMIGLQEYVIDYITKPFDNEDLIEKTRFFMSYLQD
jgi:DNA-binding response OmpR family regulator